MKTTNTLLITFCLLAPLRGSAADAAAEKSGVQAMTGRFLFDKETFAGNGRTCASCHSQESGTASIDQIQQRFALNPDDAIFRSPDSDALDGQSYTRLLTTATIKIDVPLPPNVRLVSDPTATKATFFRGIPTVKNVTTLQPFLMSDGRESSSDL